jgi:hypothetical protein
VGLKTVVLVIVLIVVLFVSIIATVEWWLDDAPSNASPNPEFFVGVEFAYSNNVGDLKGLVDKVKDYTNLFVIGSVDMTFNRTALDESCDYIYNAGLYFIVLFTDTLKYRQPNSTVYEALFWIYEARQKYGDKFLGVYRYDEPGGNQLDQGASALLNITEATAYGTYTNASMHYVDYLNILIRYYKYTSDEVFTADYGLYWYDYKAGYDAVFAEFGWNHNRQLQIALCRGAAEAYNKDWGAIITWESTESPYIESGEELYEDMVLAYKTGAKYVVVFDYPKIGQYGILSDERGHFDAMKDFWTYIHSNPQEHGAIQGEAAYVLPQDYGFGFRSPTDKIWGLWNADNLSEKVWNDANTLIEQYGARLNIIYDDPEVMNAIESHYDKLFFWNQTIT